MIISETPRTMTIMPTTPIIFKLFDSSFTVLARLASLSPYGFLGFVVPPEILAKVNECAKTDLVGTRDWWFGVLKWSTTTVAVGLLLELPELRYELMDIARNRIQRLKYRIVLSDNDLEIFKVVAFIGWILIVAGVVGERYAEVRVNNLDAGIQGCNAARLAEAIDAAGDAKASAIEAAAAAKRAKDESDSFAQDIVSAKTLAASAESHLADALERAANAETKLAEFKAQSAPRRLDPKQQASIAARLSSFSGERADMSWSSDSFESGTFASDLEKALSTAHWAVSNRPFVTGFGGAPPAVLGVVIFTEPTDRSELVGVKLAEALTSEKVLVSVVPISVVMPSVSTVITDRKSLDPYATRVWIDVGNHP
jgi:hypothetical protein